MRLPSQFQAIRLQSRGVSGRSYARVWAWKLSMAITVMFAAVHGASADQGQRNASGQQGHRLTPDIGGENKRGQDQLILHAQYMVAGATF